MTFRQFIRPSEADEKIHEHDATEVTGVFGFLRALKAKIDGSLRVTGNIESSNWVNDTTGYQLRSNGDAEFNGEVRIGSAASSQLKLHGPNQQLNILETDGADYPNRIFIIDANAEIGRIMWETLPATFVELMRFYGPNHGTQANDVEIRTGAGATAFRWDDSLGQFLVFNDIVGDTDNDFYSRSYRTRVGPDASDFWLLETHDSGDSFNIRQFDSSAAATLDRMEFVGKGTGITNQGDFVIYDMDGNALLHWDESVGAWNFTDPISRAAEPAYLFKEQVRYTADGTFTKADYPGLRAVRVRCVGGGGAGGGAGTTAAGQGGPGGGGGSGAYAEAWILDADIATTEAVTVGTGGTGGTGAGGAGNDSVFDTISGEVRADGGSGGGAASVAAVLSSFGNRGGGGLASNSTGDLVMEGSDGTNGFGTAVNRIHPGAGGASMMSGVQSQTVVGTTAAGGAGVLYGGGGGGAGNGESQGAAASGGNGADGIVIVDVYV